MSKPDYFSSVVSRIGENSVESTVSMLSITDRGLREHLVNELRNSEEANGFLADPVFESMFAWEAAEQTMDDLAGSFLQSSLVDAMDKAGDHRFGRDWSPFKHQIAAWKILISDKPQSVVVTSGTGSGKTECFMVPILNDLVGEYEHSGDSLVGVRALFIYPLNALINSQRERLRAWTSAYDDGVRFCLYNGNTEENKHPDQSKYPNEILTRKSLRSTPPPMLVTNATMLEYMLVRQVDEPIISQSHGKLRWIVLDEAHTYIGSQAAELSLLLRRVMHTFGVSADDVRFVATSATIGDGDQASKIALQTYLASLAGIGNEQVVIVGGKRDVPTLPTVESNELTLTELLNGDMGEPCSVEQFNALAGNKTACALRQALTSKSVPQPLSKLSEKVFGGASRQGEILSWLDICSHTLLPGPRASKPEVDAIPFLPLRGHLFHQVMSGLWCCADKSCSEKQSTPLAEGWPFGRAYTQRRSHCECGAPVYELVFCYDCNQPHLMANEKNGELVQFDRESVDEFSLDIDPDEDVGEDGAIESNTEQRFIAPEESDSTIGLSIERETLIITSIGMGTLDLCIVDDISPRCACCGYDGHGRPFRQSYLGTPFYISSSVPTLLDACQDSEKALDKPSRGRRLITFTDSRQGTARISTKVQQDSERDTVRGLVYAAVANRMGEVNEEQCLKDLERIRSYDEKISRFKGRDEDLVAEFEELKQDLIEKVEAAKTLQPLSWYELVTQLQSSPDVSRWILDYYRDLHPALFDSNVGSRTLSEMLLLREFARRPKRQNSLETLGLVSIQYPGLNRVNTVPSEWSELQLSLDDWRKFLKVSLDFYVRENTILQIPNEWVDWMGARVYPKSVLNPQSEEGRSNRIFKWPQVNGTRSNRLIRLICVALNLDPTNALNEDLLNAIMRSAWSALTSDSKILKPLPNTLNYALDREQLAFAVCEKAWICPNTHRLIDNCFKGLSPYLPFNATQSDIQCNTVDLSVCQVDASVFTSDADRRSYIRQWIQQDENIQKLRSENLWTDVSDKVLQGGQFFRAAEHSAQQPASRLARYEALFKQGKLNVMSCSTTMEMGVDIGGISVVAMNNVPPHPANYLQRAGRAGRRGETQALAFTICKDNPHERSVFSNPLWPFITNIPSPYITLNSGRIIQRHINSLLLSYFLKGNFSDQESSLINLSCEWFFATTVGELTPYVRMAKWMKSFAVAEVPEDIKKGIQLIIENSVLAGNSPTQLIQSSIISLETIADRWIPQYNALKDELEALGNVSETDPYRKKLQYDIKCFGKDYLLAELASKSFLPGYGFPTGIATFDHYSIHDYKKNKYRKNDSRARIDNINRMKERPGRDISIAIREYAPGSDVVLDGLVYRSAGILLNKFAPDEEYNEPVKVSVEWRCQKCGHIDQSAGALFTGACTVCDARLLKENTKEFVEPEGFAVDFYSSPTTDVSMQAYIPVQEPWVTANSLLADTFNPLLGGYKCSGEGHIFHHSDGANGYGYAVCLRCGRADSMISEGEFPQGLQPLKPHRRLQGKPEADNSSHCIGSDEPYAIQPNVYLGASDQTDVFELYLRDMVGGLYRRHQNGDKLAWTLAVVLRQALADIHGINVDEMGYTVKPSTIENCDYPVSGIVLFDRCGGGAGFASAAPRYLKEMLQRARQSLECSAHCDSVCQNCLQGYDTRFHMNLLDRHEAIQYLDVISPLLQLPSEARVFGEQTRFCLDGIDAEINYQAQRGFNKLRIYLYGSCSDWDIGRSGLKTRCMSLLRCFNHVELVLCEKPSIQIKMIDREDLWALSKIGVTIIQAKDAPKVEAEGVLLTQLVSNSTVITFGANKISAGIPNEFFWQFDGAFQVVSESLPVVGVIDLDARVFAPERSPSDVEVEIGNQFDGKANGFGLRVWQKLKVSHELLKNRLEGEHSIEKITYSDAYVSSPITFLLFMDAIDGLKQSMLSWNSPPIFLTTGLKQVNPRARGLYADWHDPQLQEEVFEGFCDYAMSEKLYVELKDKREMAHDRTLSIFWKDGDVTKIRLDQGFGSWGLSGRHSNRFDNRADKNTQIQSLLEELSSMRVANSKDFFIPVVVSHRGKQ